MADALGITWLGHATVLLELDGVRLLTDPVLRERVGPLVRVGAAVAAIETERIDAILLSHLHADHADAPSLRLLPASTPVLAPVGAARWLSSHGVRTVHELAPDDSLPIGSLEVTATVAEHDGRRRPLGATAPPIGFVMRGSQACYFAGDTDLFGAMADLSGTIDVALLPVWGWGPNLGPGHLDPERAAEAAARISPSVAIPIHWGTLAPGWPFRRPKDPRRPAREFAALAARRAPEVDVRVLEPGERIELP
ncbi:MAG: MBL fold metallo-hydrolase [Solirubrobacteraceae bacterium]